MRHDRIEQHVLIVFVQRTYVNKKDMNTNII